MLQLTNNLSWRFICNDFSLSPMPLQIWHDKLPFCKYCVHILEKNLIKFKYKGHPLFLSHAIQTGGINGDEWMSSYRSQSLSQVFHGQFIVKCHKYWVRGICDTSKRRSCTWRSEVISFMELHMAFLCEPTQLKHKSWSSWKRKESSMRLGGKTFIKDEITGKKIENTIRD